MNNIFEFLDWILKKTKKEPIDENTFTPHLLNRWLSMVDGDVANIVNSTTNRWLTIQPDISVLEFSKIQRGLLPKRVGYVKYIKKPIKEPTKEFDILNDNSSQISKRLEISKKELKCYDDMLAKLKSINK